MTTGVLPGSGEKGHSTKKVKGGPKGPDTAKRKVSGKPTKFVTYKATAVSRARGLSPTAQIQNIRAGIPAREVFDLSGILELSQDLTYKFLGLPRSTVERNRAAKKLLSPERSERVMATRQLVDLVSRMVEESGNPEGFDAGKWLGSWLSEPHPALGGVPPGSYLDTHMGIELVRDLLLRAQSGAYS